MSVNIALDFPDFSLAVRGRLSEIRLFMVAQIQTNRGLLFDSEGRYNGRPGWAPLKFRRGQILSDRGVLRKSLAPPGLDGRPGPNGTVVVEPDSITIGTNLLYAALMNYGTEKMPGGVLRPVHAKALRIPLPAGANATPYAKQLRKSAKSMSYEVAEGVTKRAKFIFRKSVKIPARPFNDWNSQDQEELDDAIVGKLAQVMNDA